MVGERERARRGRDTHTNNENSERDRHTDLKNHTIQNKRDQTETGIKIIVKYRHTDRQTEKLTNTKRKRR